MDKAFKAGVLTLSTKGAKGLRKDESGELVVQMLRDQGYDVVCKELIPDDCALLAETLMKWVDEKELSLIVTSGGTGLSPMDYRNMMIRLFAGQGFRTYQTNEPNVMMRPENLFMARIGDNVSEPVQRRFKMVRFNIDD